MIVWREEGKLLGLFCAVLCAPTVHTDTHINRPSTLFVG